jgi:hypothetical protein
MENQHKIDDYQSSPESKQEDFERPQSDGNVNVFVLDSNQRLDSGQK